MKAVLKISGFILLLLFVICAALLFTLQTSHSTWLTQQIVHRFASDKVQISDAQFIFPNELTLKRITLDEISDSALTIDSASFTFQLDWDITQPMKIEHILISGINLPEGLPDKDKMVNLINKLQPKRLEIQSLDFASQALIARDVNLIYEPKPEFPLGLLQISSEQIYWAGEALNLFEAKVNITETKNLIDQMSFDWRGGSIQLMAEQSNSKQWIINDILVRNLHLDRQDFSQKVATQLTKAGLKIDQIEQAELIQFSWQEPEFELNQSHVKLNNWHKNLALWQQSASISLIAESIIWNDLRLLEPQINLDIESSILHINQLELLFEQGKITAKGELTAKDLHLYHLGINNLEWSIGSSTSNNKLWNQLLQLNSLVIDEVEVERSQIIYLGEDHRWQVSNLNAEGANLHLRKEAAWGLWNGELVASANSMSAAGITSIKPYIAMATKDQQWKLKQLFIPIHEGLIEASSEMALSTPSRPWSIKMTAYGLPLQSITDQLKLAVDWQGVADVDLNFSGLGGDELMLRHSLTGTASISPHAIQLMLPFTQQEKKNLIVPPVIITAQRGVISVPEITFIGEEVTGYIEGKMDLVEPKREQINLSLNTDCFSLKTSLPNGRSQLYLDCP